MKIIANMPSNKRTQRKEKNTIIDSSQSKAFPIFQKIIAINFFIIFSIILIIVICFNWMPHCTNKHFILPNIISLLISLFSGGIINLLFKKTIINEKNFRISIIITFVILYIAQIFILYFSFFKTGWDAGLTNTIADQIIEEGMYTTAGSNAYLSVFKNNVFIVTILAFIKSIPFIGGKYFTILAINALLVNIAGLFVCLTLKKLISPKFGILSILITTPLLLFSPWIIIPYTDTFTILIPILVFYIYISTNKWWKYGPIIFFSLIGCFIKPTAIIVLIAIILTELFKNRLKKPKLNKDFWLRSLAITNGITLAFLIRYISFSNINYQPVINVTQASYIHFLAMGQNEENCGQFLDEDYQEIQKGPEFEMQKFCGRITKRSFTGHLKFFTQKLLANYDDGTFAWSGEGTFYKEVPQRNNPISNVITSFYYQDGSNHKWFMQLEQTIWIFVLFGCIFALKKKSSSQETVLQLSLIGIFLFVMLFEARARYLFCFAPMFIACALLGYYNLINTIIKYKHKHNCNTKTNSK